MPEIEVVESTTTAPERVLEAAHDFSDRRCALWPDVHPRYFLVHRIGDGSAEVTEGNPSPIGPFWERLRYDWSQPGSVKGVVVESNIFLPGSTWQLTATPTEQGSRVTVTMDRRFTGLKGRLVGALMTRTGLAKRTTSDHLRQFLRRVEAGELQS